MRARERDRVRWCVSPSDRSTLTENFSLYVGTQPDCKVGQDFYKSRSVSQGSVCSHDARALKPRSHCCTALSGVRCSYKIYLC